MIAFALVVICVFAIIAASLCIVVGFTISPVGAIAGAAVTWFWFWLIWRSIKEWNQKATAKLRQQQEAARQQKLIAQAQARRAPKPVTSTDFWNRPASPFLSQPTRQESSLDDPDWI